MIVSHQMFSTFREIFSRCHKMDQKWTPLRRTLALTMPAEGSQKYIILVRTDVRTYGQLVLWSQRDVISASRKKH